MQLYLCCSTFNINLKIQNVCIAILAFVVILVSNLRKREDIKMRIWSDQVLKWKWKWKWNLPDEERKHWEKKWSDKIHPPTTLTTGDASIRTGELQKYGSSTMESDSSSSGSGQLSCQQPSSATYASSSQLRANPDPYKALPSSTSTTAVNTPLLSTCDSKNYMWRQFSVAEAICFTMYEQAVDRRSAPN